MQMSQTEWSQVSVDWLRQESGVTEVENPVKVSSKQKSRLGEATEQVNVAGHCGNNNELVKSGGCDQVFKQQQEEDAISVDDQQVLDSE